MATGGPKKKSEPTKNPNPENIENKAKKIYAYIYACVDVCAYVSVDVYIYAHVCLS